MNPVVAAVAADSAVAATRSGARAAKSGAKQVNIDTRGALSWVILAGVVIGGYYMFKALKGISKVSDGVTNIVGEVTGIATDTLQGVREFFTTDPSTGGGMLKDIADPTHRPVGATINLLQAQTISRQLFDLFKGV